LERGDQQEPGEAVTKTVYDAVKGALQDMTHAIVTTITKAFIMGPNQQGNDRNTQDDVKKNLQ
jgi:hypothetical protein